MGILDTGIQDKRTQLYFHPDKSFEFRKLPVFEDDSMAKKTGERITAAWPLLNGNTLDFDGYKSISADGVTLAHSRDIIYDPFNRIHKDDKPEKGHDLVKEWTKKRALASVYRVQTKSRNQTKLERMTIYLFIPTIILALTVALKVLLK